MSSSISVQRPYVVASMPQPVNRSSGRYVVGEVHGGMPGSRKRKRAELAVGIDGEGVNLYDIQASRLITSYALPPQSSFTCAPHSIRIGTSKTGVERRTYVSTKESQPCITLFRDSTGADRATQTTSVSHQLEASESPVVYLDTISQSKVEGDTQAYDLLIVRENGEIKCLDGLDLQEKWTSPATAIGKDETMATIKGHRVVYAQLTNAATASKGLFKGRQDIMASFPEEVSQDGFNPEILVLVSKPADAGSHRTRMLHVVSFPRETSSVSKVHSVHSLFSTKLPRPDKKLVTSTQTSYDLHVASGLLFELAGEFVNTYSFAETFPVVQSKPLADPADSFLRLSSSFIVTSSRDAINIYNSRYMSLQSSVPLAATNGSESNSRKRKSLDELPTEIGPCQLLTYFQKSNTVVALSGSDLVALQLDTQEDRSGKRRATGLLIDALGCGVQRRKNTSAPLAEIPLASFGAYLPRADDETWAKDTADLDTAVQSQDIERFEAILAGHLNMTREEAELVVWRASSNGQNGTSTTSVPKQDPYGQTTTDVAIDSKPVPTWKWPRVRRGYPAYDQRWVIFALSRIFKWTRESSELTAGEGRLLADFYPHNALHWLIETGNLTVSNVEAALKHYKRMPLNQYIPAGQLTDALIELDPEMKLLLNFLTGTFLGASELLYAIRNLMQSLEIFTEKTSVPAALTEGPDSEELVNGDAEAAIEREEAEAEAALQIAEYHLGDGSSIRGQALSLALAKLYTHPSGAIIKALQSTLTTNQIVSLIHLLRFELAKGSWTARYLDADQNVSDDAEISDNTIILVSGLLNNCVDAIGAGGWLFGDAMLVNGDHYESEELIESLKLEVSAALEGIEEAVYLKGLTSEMVRFGEAIQQSIPLEERKKKTDTDTDIRQPRNVRPVLIPTGDKASAMLPFGMKAEQQITKYRVGAGGEVKARSKRDIGRLKSQKVGKYSLERIVI